MTYWTKKNLKRVKKDGNYFYVPKKGYHLVPCGHEGGAYLDNCSVCAPLWDEIAIPVEYKTLAEYREATWKKELASR